MLPTFPPEAVITTEPTEPEQLQREGWSPEGHSSNWDAGPWDEEPDQVRWVDPATGYQCMIKRSRMGNLNGYVYLPPYHHWYGLGYSACVNNHEPLTYEARLAKLQASVDEARAKQSDYLHIAELMLEAMTSESGYMRDYKEYPCLSYDREDRCQSPEAVLNVHGGVTYSGDLDKAGTWCFGFDTAHSGDLSPGMEATRRYTDTLRGGPNPYRDPAATYDPKTGTKTEHGQADVYKDMQYVKLEVEGLAKQLLELEHG